MIPSWLHTADKYGTQFFHESWTEMSEYLGQIVQPALTWLHMLAKYLDRGTTIKTKNELQIENIRKNAISP